MHIESTLPLWLVLPLAALAAFLAWLLYVRNQQDSVLMKPVRILLSITRMLVMIIVGLLIISPWIRTTVNRQNNPIYVVAQDNSVSITPTGDKKDFIEARSKLMDEITGKLQQNFQVRKVVFGSKTVDGQTVDFSDPVTDPGELFAYLRMYGQSHDLGGVFITSDGVATRDLTFSDAARNFPYPVTILASGDSTRSPDVRIQDVVTNDLVRKNSLFPVRIYYNTGNYTSRGFRLQISGKQGIIAEKSFGTTDQIAPYEEFLIKAADQGTMQLIARIIPDEPDKNQDNNVKRFSVGVIEQEGRILCLYESAHPDIDAVFQALKSINTLNLDLAEASDFKGTGEDYDLIILHGLPSLRHPQAELLKRSAERQVPVLYIIGKTTDPVLFNSENHGLTLGNRRKGSESSRGILNSSFTLFSLPADFNNHLNTWPPLELSFETYTPDPGSVVLMKQKILNIDLADPLIAFSSSRGVKYGFFCGEGIWLWRLHEFREQKNHDYFDDWLSRTVQYLMTDENNDRFRVTIPEEIFAFSEIRINGHLLNNSLEPVNDPDVIFTLTDSIGQKTEFQMGRVNTYYELIINGFPAGTYRYSAETRLGSEELRREGILDLLTRPIEQTGPVADFESLRSIARNTGGEFFGPGKETDLLTYLDELKPVESRIKKEYKWYDLINFRWLLGVLVLFLAIEWFVRRWFGIH